MTRNNAFTLIELLIVVAIIGILAAIAVPNFLNAQTRAKLARTEADLKALETALESYRLDNNAYPATYELFRLTTPIAFMTYFPEDPFGPILKDDTGYGSVLNAYGSPIKSYYIYHGPETYSTHPDMIRMGIQWVLTGLGPDKGWFDNTNGPQNCYPRYAASNGLISRGNFSRIGPGNIPEQTYREYWDRSISGCPGL